MPETTTHRHPYGTKPHLVTTGVLGKGAFGVAYKVNRGPHTYCLKEIVVRSMSPQSKDEAMAEVRCMKETCRHPNVITYVDSWFDRHKLCILMEFAPNGSMDRMIQKNMASGVTLTEMQICHFMQQIVAALSYMHDVMRIIHRDIKPANLLLDQFGVVKLSDFGLSKSLNGGMCQTMVGTPLYLAPEQVLNQDYSFGVDMWSTGIVVYELMTYKSPWAYPDDSRLNVPTLYTRICNDPVPLAGLKGYSSKIIDAVQWMLRNNVLR